MGSVAEGQFDASQLLKGGLDLAVLAVLAQGEDYGYGIVRHIHGAGLPHVREASVYGTLTRLFRAGFLTARMEASADGPPRRYYGLSPPGRTYLAEGRSAWTATSTTLNTLLAGTEEIR
jgi:PadR family transcriptional regulator PadR